MKLDQSVPNTSISEQSDQIAIDPVWQAGYTGKDVVIAIVDTGINFTHPALTGKMEAQRSFHNVIYGYSTNAGPQDYEGHGTEVASVAAGYEEGVFKGTAYDAKLVNAKIGYENNIITSLSVIAALDWAISLPQVDIVSMSLSEFEEGFNFDPFEQLMNAGVRQGKIMLSSAGNEGNTKDDVHQVGSPSTAPETISVAMSDQDHGYFYGSSEGPTYGNEAKPDILALGTNVKVAINGKGVDYGYATGTSFSTPMVAGGIATLLQAAVENNNKLTPGLVKSLIMQTATDLNISPYQQGYGIMNTTRALIKLQEKKINPIIAPRPNDLLKRLDLPLTTAVSFPLSLIGFNNLPEITTDPGIAINSTIRYFGNTSIINLQLTALDTDLINQVMDLNLTLIDSINDSAYSYQLPIKVVAKPVFTVLLDLKHTIYDSLQVINQPAGVLERLDGRDIKHLSTQIEEIGGYIEENLDNDFSLSTLSEFDVLWMPSAFVSPSPSPYDHTTQNTVLTKEELFNLVTYIEQGGSILTDFDGSSLYSNYYTFSTHERSLNMLLRALGIQLVDGDNSHPQLPVLTSSLVNSRINLPTGNRGLMNGIPIVSGTVGYSAVARISPAGGTIFIDNTREWRTDAIISTVAERLYLKEIANLFGSKLNITSIDLKPGIISIANTLNLENASIELFVNNQNIPSEISQVNNILQIRGEFNVDDQVKVEITRANSTIFQLDEIIPAANLQFRSQTIQMSEEQNEIRLQFEKDVPPEYAIFVEYQNQTIDPSFENYENTVIIRHVVNDSVVVHPEDYSIKILDKYGNIHKVLGSQLDLIEGKQVGANQIYLITIFSSLLVILILFSRKKFSD